MSKLRKRSIDSRADTDVSHSIENFTTTGGGGNTLTVPQLPAIASIPSSPSAANLLATNSPKAGLKSTDQSQNQQSSNNNLQTSQSTTSGSGGGAKLLTISEQNEKSKLSSLFDRKQSDANFKYPVLPPLNEAQSVKQKWSILLSKAKGGVENLPKAFLCSMDQTESISSNLNDRTKLISKSSAEEISKISVDSSNNKLQHQKIQSSSSNQFNDKPSSSQTKKDSLDESFGFKTTTDYDHSVKSAAAAAALLDDEDVTKNPKKLLNSLIEMRQDLKSQIENTNIKMSKIDKKITEVLQFMVSSGGLSNNTNRNDNQQYFVGSHEYSRQPPKNLTFVDSSTSFGLNSNLHLSQIQSQLGSGLPPPPNQQTTYPHPHHQHHHHHPNTVYIKAKPSTSLLTASSSTTSATTTKVKSSKLMDKSPTDTKISSRTTGTTIITGRESAGTGSVGGIYNFQIENEYVRPSSLSTSNLISSQLSKLSASTDHKHTNKEHKHRTHRKRSASKSGGNGGGSNKPSRNATPSSGLKNTDLTIAAAVEGASKILSNAALLNQKSSQSTTSNYNVNLIQDSDLMNKNLTSSASDYLLKETSLGSGIVSSSRGMKVKSSSKKKLFYDGGDEQDGGDEFRPLRKERDSSKK